MKIKPIKCPSCGAMIAIDEGMDTCKCSFCGCAFSIDDEKQEYTYNKNININIKRDTSHTEHYIEDAEVIRAKTEKWKLIGKYVGWGAAVLYIVVFFAYLSFGAKRLTDQENRAIASGMISAGSCDDYIGENYNSVVAHLEAAGFTNIQLVDLNDTGIFFWTSGEVESVSVGGDKNFSKTDYFQPDIKVVIAYH